MNFLDDGPPQVGHWRDCPQPNGSHNPESRHGLCRAASLLGSAGMTLGSSTGYAADCCIMFALTTFLSAFLLFQVQPLLSKAILPWFGGSPAVWTVCMLFFQVTLFVGYLYSHLATRYLSKTGQAALHVVLLLVATLLGPITPAASWKPGPADDPTMHILMLLTVCVGLPYFLLSATGPLLQAWFTRTTAARSANSRLTEHTADTAARLLSSV